MTINVATYEQAAEILAEVLGIDLNDIDLSALGEPTTPASNNTSGNAHAKLNWLLAKLAEVVTTSATANANTATIINNTATANLGAPNAASSNAVGAVAHAKLNWLLANVNTLIGGRVIKSVQSGWTNIPLIYQGQTFSVPLSPVTANKAFHMVSVNSEVFDTYVQVSVTNNALAFKNITNDRSVGFSGVNWQVIEFY